MAMASEKAASMYSVLAFSSMRGLPSAGAGDRAKPAALPGVLAGLAADVGYGLGPDEVGEGLGDAGAVDEGVADVDEELEGEGEAVAEEAGGDEDAVVVGEGDVAVADGLVAELGGVGGGDHGGVGVEVVAILDPGGRSSSCAISGTHGQRDEVVGLAGEGSGDGDGDGLDHAGEIGRGDGGVAVGGVADAVGGALQGGFASDLGGLDEPGLYAFGHKAVF